MKVTALVFIIIGVLGGVMGGIFALTNVTFITNAANYLHAANSVFLLAIALMCLDKLYKKPS